MKIKFGAIVVAGSGKIGGHVASKNRGGAYLRTKVTPTNPNTTAQASARALLSSLSTAWSGLTEAQRLGWNNAVKDFSSTDVFGDIKNPSGINLFVKLNANLAQIDEPLMLSAPAKVEVPFTPVTTAVYSVGTPANTKIMFAGNEYNDVNLLISATPKVSAGTSFVKNLYRKIGYSYESPATILFDAMYSTKFGDLAIGDKIFVTVTPIMTNGQKGIPQSVEVIAVA